MAFREVSVLQIKELLRRWLNGEGERTIARAAGVARTTARNYIMAALELGVDRSGGDSQLTDELIGQICERVRPRRPDGHGESWRRLLNEEEQIRSWVRGPQRREDRHPAPPPRHRGPSSNTCSLRFGTLRCRSAQDDSSCRRPATR